MSDANSHLSSTIESLSQGLKQAKPGATRSIHSWTKTLNESGDSSLTAIADELQKLDGLLGDKNASPAELQKSLTTLGKHTTAAAKKTDGAVADKLKQLGKLLTDAAGGLQ